jgi:hypothetical protein
VGAFHARGGVKAHHLASGSRWPSSRRG